MPASAMLRIKTKQAAHVSRRLIRQIRLLINKNDLFLYQYLFCVCMRSTHALHSMLWGSSGDGGEDDDDVGDEKPIERSFAVAAERPKPVKLSTRIRFPSPHTLTHTAPGQRFKRTHQRAKDAG